MSNIVLHRPPHGGPAVTTRRVELVPHTKLMLITGWAAVVVHAFTFTTILVFIITRSF